MGEFGIEVGGVRVDFPRVMQRMKASQAHIGEYDAPARFEEMGIEVIFGGGRFTGPDAFEVAGRRIKARRFLLATEARPSCPRCPASRMFPISPTKPFLICASGRGGWRSSARVLSAWSWRRRFSN